MAGGTTARTVETTREGYVGRITLSRPDALNTFSSQLAQELDDALRDLDADEWPGA